MYLEYFGLTKPPFHITPDTNVFYQGSDRGAALKALCYAVSHGEGIVKVVGEVGTGKTMLCRMLPLALPEGVDWVYLAHPSLSPEHTLHAIAQELGMYVEERADKLAVMRLLHRELLQRYSQNRRVVVLIEEAQGMPLDTLEEIRLLSNLETDEHKLLQIVLFGQPELDENLSTPRIRQLRERITHNFYLDPLRLSDIQAYLNFRLHAAGYSGPEIFTRKASRFIAKYSKGLIRRINIIADKALLAAYTQDRRKVTMNDIKHAVRDSQFISPKRWWHLWVSTAAICLICLSFVLVDYTRSAKGFDSYSGLEAPVKFLLAKVKRKSDK